MRKGKIFQTSLGLIVGILLLISGYVFAQEKSKEQPQPLANVPIGESAADYTLGKGDAVEITVKNHPEFTGEFVIGPDGNIQYNFAGDIKAEGLTKHQLKEILIQRLERYVKSADINVIVLTYNSKFVYMLGELGRPGKYPMKGDKVSLREAIMAAGLPTRAAALRRVYVIKPDKSAPNYKKVDIYKLLYKGLLEDDLTLTPGDLVVVPSTVPTEVNRALTNLLSPFTKAASIDALFNR